MTDTPPNSDDRRFELLAGRTLDVLSDEELAELERLEAAGEPDGSLADAHVPEAGTPDAGTADADMALGELLVAMDEHDRAGGDIPDGFAARLAAQGRSFARAHPTASPGDQPSLQIAQRPEGGPSNTPPGLPRRSARGPWVAVAALAASLALAASGLALWMAQSRAEAESLHASEMRALLLRVEENDAVIAAAQARAASLEDDLAAAADREIAIAAQLAEATQALDRANLAIARFETPQDPAELAQNRRRLLEVPGSIRVAWSPFDLPDAPAEQRGAVQGDVVWNDELQTGYLRFVGLRPNDPAVEQYQVWVIDERGLEQKISGGVFNATAEGEVIVPIDPGIDVGRVALFAITVENPGGTWVPDLERRVVVAPREG